MDLVGRWRGRDHVLDVVQPHLDRVSNALGADAAFIHFDALLCIAIDHHVRACVRTWARYRQGLLSGSSASVRTRPRLHGRRIASSTRSIRDTRSRTHCILLELARYHSNRMRGCGGCVDM